MNAESDHQLLRKYAVQHDESAFRELVQRHTDFIYSAALRQVESDAAARDLTQAVFTDLARRAPDMIEKHIGESLAGWLHRATRYAALNHLRDSRRRRENERQAMEQLLTNSEASADWEQIRPTLDEALDSLEATDREALLLRYFKNQDFRAVGAQLGVSDDTAQKRVSRAVERLREFFAQRGVTVGAGGLVVLISTNAVQAAPVGLAVTISAAALTGTVATTSTFIAATTKTIAMTTLQKTLVTATVAVLAGAGLYQARQAAQLRDQIQTLQQQQAPLEEQVQQLQSELVTANNRVAGLSDDLARAMKNNVELLKLRGEVGTLRNAARIASQAAPANAALEASARSWLNRANQLKDYFAQNPGENIPELQFLTDREWLIISGDTGLDTEDFRTPDDFRRGAELLRIQAESRFGNKVSEALRKYASANNGEFPAALSQLKPYCDSSVGELLVDAYEIKPSSVLPSLLVKDMNIKTEWIITRKTPVNANTRSRLALFADGNAYWQSPR